MRKLFVLFLLLAPAAMAATPVEIALAQFQAQDVVVTDHYTSPHNGVTHVYLQQRHQGIEIYGAVANVNVRDGAVLSLGSDFVATPEANRTTPVLDAAAALSALGLTAASPGKLVYQPVDGALRLAWSFEIDDPSQQHYWNIRVDAENGALLAKDDLVDHDNFGVPAREERSLQTFTPRSIETNSAGDGSTYRVFAWPLESPNHGPRTLASDPADATASPFGWHDTNGAAGAEFTVTRGNNAHAYCDTAGDGVPDPLSDPNGGPGLDFDFDFDPGEEPLFFRDAAVTNLFYWNNIIHDVFYRYGFTEAAGNFQVNNYGRGGAGNDDVRAEAQDGTPNGASTPLNNANFLTPVDGSRPRMQMYLWQPPFPNRVTVQPPSAAAGDYDATDAQFGAPVPPAGITGNVVLANDGVGTTADGCEPLVAFPPGAIALMERGTCSFTIKVLNAQNAGAIAAILHNNVPGGPALRMGFATTPSPDTNVARIVIPSVMVSYNDGHRFRAGLPLTATVSRKLEQDRLRDGDFDNGVITHEYGHGISNRLTGGRLNVNCLNNQEQMGEGWSDWLALALTARAGDTATQRRGVGTYVVYQPTDGFGIRPTPYSTDMSINPATYDSIKTAAVPHGVGYVWATMLWDVYWSLVDAHGFNPNLYDHWSTGGNNLAIQLVMDGMKLQKCSPGFVDGRDAILLADQVLTGGANACRLWSAFARRGLGVGAKQGSSASSVDGTQAFDAPPACLVGIAVDPPSMASSQIANTTTTQTLRILSGSAPGAIDLTWSIAEDLPWLTVSPSSGTTGIGETSNVTVTFNSNGLATPSAHSGTLRVTSNAASTPLIEVPVTLNVIYDFRGFFGTVKNAPAMNRAKAGSTVPVLFSLGGNHGSDIFAAGSPSSAEIDCDTKSPIGDAEPALGSLTYDALTDRYQYKWRTQGDWLPGSCRAFTMQFDDGTSRQALFRIE